MGGCVCKRAGVLGVLVCLAGALLSSGCGDLLTGESDAGKQNFAVIVGISSYQNAAFNLKWAEEDALDFYDTLHRTINWENDKIALLTNSTATKDAIKAALLGLGKRASADDQVVFFFSGRGTYGPDQPPYDEGDGLDEYLMTYDSRVASTSQDLNDDELEAIFAALPMNNVVIILDTSFTPGRANSMGRDKGFARDARATPRGLDGIAKELLRPGYVLLTASQPGDPAHESNQLRNGVFSHYLTEGFRGAASPSKRLVTVQQAYEYAATRVSAYAPGQSPQYFDSRGKAFKLAKY